jgi:stage II sporulation protein AA (anti-sigma F factor antagonist)
MKMESYVQGSTLIIELSGEIDHHTSVQIREWVDREYQRKRAKNILFNFSEVKFMDSSGIGMLMGRYRNVAICGGEIALVHVDDPIDKILDLSGIYKLMKNYKDEKTALSHLGTSC